MRYTWNPLEVSRLCVALDPEGSIETGEVLENIRRAILPGGSIKRSRRQSARRIRECLCESLIGEATRAGGGHTGESS
jgi:hypothetical protein